MAAAVCRQGMRDAAIFLCWKHSQGLPFVAAAAAQQQHHHQHRQCLVSARSRHSLVTSRGQLINTKKIDSFELASLGPVAGNPHPRPVVVMIGWLNARKKHLQKYQELYWDQGVDVLTMDVSPIHIIRPKMGIKYTARLLNVLQGNKELAGRQVMFHGFSIGAFIYTQLQILLQNQQQKALTQSSSTTTTPDPLASDLSGRITGLVLDSPAYIDYMCRGIANSVTTNPLGRALINNGLLLYLAAFPKSVTFHYHESHRIYHDNDVPTLILYSPVDMISSAETSERYVKEWKAKGFPAFTRKFPDSSHVSHFRNYPQEYVSALNSFVQGLDLLGVEKASSAKVVELPDGEAVGSEEEEEEAAASAAPPPNAPAVPAPAPEVQRLQAKAP